MTTDHFTLPFFVTATPQQVDAAINDVQAWWSADVTGTSQQQGDIFNVRFGDVHYTRHLVEEIVPAKKIVWLVTDSHLSFLQNKTEWTGTRMVFELEQQEAQTKVVFTHLGLLPEVECFEDCSVGWTKFLLHSLKHLIETGKGNLHVLNSEIAEKEEIINAAN